MNQLKAYLNQITPITELTWNALKVLMVEKQLKKGEIFSETNKITTKIAFLKEGVVRSFYTNQNGQEYNKNFFVAPVFIGSYTSLITQKPNQLAQQALTDCIIIEMDYLKVKALYDTCHDLERLARIQAENYFVQKEIREVNLVMLEAKERYEIFKKEYPTLEQLIPQYHIASFLGITPTQLSRIRAEKP